MKHYDYIFAGAGLSSLMMVYKMSIDRRFNKKSVLLIDVDDKQKNDRTWCFWKQHGSSWDNIVYREWDTAVFRDERGDVMMDFEEYRYKMIRGIDFYTHVFNEIKKYPNIEFLTQKVTRFDDTGKQVVVETENENFTCGKLFNSIYNPAIPTGQKKYPVLQQHFIGWHVKTGSLVFDTERPVFMDFSIPQKGNTRFMYVLPFAPDEAIVEYTLFSKDLLPEKEYEDAIVEYLKNIGITAFEILAKEKGSIPMTVYPFWENNTKNIIHIGSAGGWTKASTGYTFRNADVISDRLIAYLLTKDDFREFHKRTRFWYYDLLLLDILYRNNGKGSTIFSSMFRNGKASLIFSFLDEMTTPTQDLKVILSCPKPLFTAAALRRLWGRLFS